MARHEVEVTSQRMFRKGCEEGHLAGERKILRRQLARKSGPLADETLARLQRSGSEDLERWAEGLLDGESLKAVFDSPR